MVVLYKDRLTGFGFYTLKRIFEAHGTVEVLNQIEMKPLKQEMVDT